MLSSWYLIDVVEGLDRVGEVLGDGHGGGELPGEHGVGSLLTFLTGKAGGRQSGGKRRRLSSRGSLGWLGLADAESILSLPNATSISSASSVLATGGSRTTGEDKEVSNSCFTEPSSDAVLLLSTPSLITPSMSFMALLRKTEWWFLLFFSF